LAFLGSTSTLLDWAFRGRFFVKTRFLTGAGRLNGSCGAAAAAADSESSDEE
jgi:hypothetical protein